MEIQVDINLTKCQKAAYEALHDDNITYLVLRYSRQIGKTIFAEISILEYMLKPKQFIIYISPTYAQGTKLYNDLYNLFEQTGLIKKSNSQTLRIELVNKSILQCYSMQSPTSIRGQTVKGLLVLDELAFFPDQTPDGQDPWMNIIFPTIKARIKTNKVLAISTPRGKRGIFWNFHKNCEAGKKHWKELVFTIYDDDLVDEDLINEIKDNVNERAFNEEFLVQFLDSSLSFFTGFEKCFKDFDFDDNVKKWMGIDLSANGKDRTIVTEINELNQVRQHVIEGTLDMKYLAICQLIDNSNNLQCVFIESNGVGAPMINQIKKLSKKKNLIKEFITTNKSKTEMLGELALLISQVLIMFNNLDFELYKEFGQFICNYSKTGNLILQAMGSKHDDRIISLGIAVACKKAGTKCGNYNISWLKNVKTNIKH